FDITDSKYVQENIPLPYQSLDINGHIIKVNNEWLELLGYSKDKVIGKWFGDFLFQEYREKFLEKFAILKEKGQIYDAEYVMIKKDGSVINVSFNGRVIYDVKGNFKNTHCVMHNITSHKQVEEKCLRHQDDLELRVQKRTLELAEMNVELKEEIAAREKKEAEILALEKRLEFIRALEHGEGPSDFEIRVTRKDGEKVDLIISAKIYSKDGYIEGAMIDITEKKRLESQIQQARKMESIGTLAGGIAHDFNNLLMGIQGYTSLMLNDLDSDHDHYNKLKNIEKQVKSGAELSAQLLGFARGGKYDVKPTDINKLLKKSAEMFGRTKKEITIREKYAPDLWTVKVDRGQIEQVFLNLFINAWQAMPDAGDIYLETSNFVFSRTYTKPHELKPGKYVRISVADTGIGMDEETASRVFDPFFTTKGVGRGTGLGLASAYGIIKNHGGIIHVYSEKGQGSTFNIYLPAVYAKADPISFHDDEEVKTGKEEAILLVDDEAIILDVGKEILDVLGYKVFLASGGNEAIEIYKENKDKIDLVILDMVMPGMGGGETYKALKSINPDIKVMLSSGYNLGGEAAEIMKQGVNDFIQKPFTMTKLSHKIRNILEKK
ncbi:MAG: PAS domain S-box protein, partial [Proteobacteria bacterium]|nr:PAS domain S-box protein [Pseudomonadota bacterium]